MNAPMLYVATLNIPGYLPMDDEPPTFETAAEAWAWHLSELERNDDYGSPAAWTLADENDPEGPWDRSETALELERMERQSRIGTVYGPTPGYDGDHDQGLAYSVDIAEDD